jgi:hypothetical protein
MSAFSLPVTLLGHLESDLGLNIEFHLALNIGSAVDVYIMAFQTPCRDRTNAPAKFKPKFGFVGLIRP